MKLIRILIALALLSFALAQGVHAQIKMEGRFEASADCSAVQSIKKQTNPGNVTLQQGRLYKLIGQNKSPPTHYFIEVPGAGPMQRWVPITCGTLMLENNPPLNVDGQTKTQNDQPTDEPFHILAVSWQPAFCELRSGKPECASQNEQSYEATNFTLHGLWPQPRGNEFCKATDQNKADSKSGNWSALPNVDLTTETRTALDRVMPGTQSKLERHEWIKHGTCYQPAVMETYYQDSVRLMQQLNASAGQAYMAANIGKEISTADLKAKFDETLGPGAGDRMKFSCKKDGNRLLLVEITIGLKGQPSQGAGLKDLIAASSPTSPDCPRFVVDEVGLQ